MSDTIGKLVEGLKAGAEAMKAGASIAEDVKRDDRIIAEKAEKMDIKNRVRAKRAELKIKKIDKRLKKKTLD
jgi:hypothetical protein